MSEALLGLPFDIHTGGIDHREIHHPNEIAQNQAHSQCDHSGARIWMHNNFLIDRSQNKDGGKMSKSAGEFLRLQLLIDKGIHPLAYRLMCLQAHYRSELEFTWDNLQAALTRLKRIVMAIEQLTAKANGATQPVNHPRLIQMQDQFDAAISDDLNSAKCLPLLEDLLAQKKIPSAQRLMLVTNMDEILGLDLINLKRSGLRLHPKARIITEAEIEQKLDLRKQAKADKDFSAADAIRDELTAQGVELMDGDPLRWEWSISI